MKITHRPDRILSTHRLLLSRFACVGLAVALLACEAVDSPSPAPSKSTPYAVGSMTRFFHDETRGFDRTGGIDSGIRVLPTEIWYPVSHTQIESDTRRASYGDYVFGNRALHRKMVALTRKSVRDSVSQEQIDNAIDAHFDSYRNSYVGVPVSQTKAPFPVIIMSHGNGGQRHNMASTAEHLAANGYVVLGPDHTGNAAFSMTGLDPALKTDPAFSERMADVIELHDSEGAYFPRPGSSGGLGLEEIKRIDAAILERVNDLRTLLDVLPRLNAGLFEGAIDLTNVGVMGRSLGAATALASLGLEPNFKGGVAVVAPSVPDFRSVVPKKWLAPPGEESVMFSSGTGFPLGELTKPTFLISSGEDRLIIKMNTALAKAFGGEMPTAQNPHPALRSAYKNSIEPVAWAFFENGNHVILQGTAHYWWPHLTKNRFSRFFQPETRYTLTPPRAAHRFQAERVLAFFDLVFGRDKSAARRLVANPDSESDFSGARIEAANLREVLE
jgi:dienelactone hydrolase